MSWKDLHEITFIHVDKPECFPEIQRAEQLALDVATVLVITGTQDQRDGEADEESQRDRDPAEQRDVVAAVDPALVGFVDGAERVRDARSDRRRRGRYRGGNRKRREILERAQRVVSRQISQ